MSIESVGTSSFRVPANVGHFEFERMLGEGGMGIVYLAKDTRLARLVAIKALREELTNTPAARERLEAEARLLAAVNSPHIASIYQVIEEGPRLYLVLEYVPGDSLSETLRRSLTFEQRVRLAAQIAAALSAAHKGSVVHRDVKPANIRVTPDDRIKVLDFGLAKALVELPSTDLPEVKTGQTGRIIGTPAYMSPEQARGEEADQRTDIWGFGCILYLILTGRPAFPGHSSDDILAAIQLNEPDWGAVPQYVPPQIVTLLRACLQKRKENRPSELSLAVDILLNACGNRNAVALPDSSTSPLHNLPPEFSSFLGRESELNELTELILRSRLVTVTGVGGTGKTRLAVETARQLVPRFPAGCWLVALDSTTDPGLVPSVIAGTLGIAERPGESIMDTLIKYLRGEPSLLVLDNCEHIVTTCARTVEVLCRGCEVLHILATSREVLHASGESVFSLSPLQVPDTSAASDSCSLASNAAVRLFVDRATQHRREFVLTDSNSNSVARICAQLDGIPLALELAAARMRVLGVDRIAERLADRFRLLTGGAVSALPRHRTLRALIDWSYDQLHDDEKQLIQRLSVFRGGCTLDAVAAVSAPKNVDEFALLELLSSLVDKSLVIADHSGEETRYRLLETIRQYAEERLISQDELVHVREQHVNHYLRVAEITVSQITALRDEGWLTRFDAEHSNFRVAFEWSITTEHLADHCLRLAAVLGRYWELRGFWHEGRARLAKALDKSTSKSCIKARATALGLAGNLANQQGDFAVARALYEESLALCRSTNNILGIATTLNNLANVPYEQGDYASARTLYAESLELERQLNRTGQIATVEMGLAEVALAEGRFDDAETHARECLMRAKQTGNERHAAFAMCYLGNVAYAHRQYDGARTLYDESLELLRRVGHKPGIALALLGLADLALVEGELQAASAAYLESLQLHHELGYRQRIALSVEKIVKLFVARGQMERAITLIGFADRLRDEIGSPRPPVVATEIDGLMATLRGNLGAAVLEQSLHAGRILTLDEAIRLATE